MKVSLTPEMEQLIARKIEAGLYPTPSEIVQEALRLLQERDEHLAALQAEVRIGFEAIERGEYEDYDERTTKRLAAQIKARGRARLAAQGERRTGAR